MGSDKGLPHHKLEEALREQKVGCAVCRLVNRTGRRYLESLLYEDVNDPGVQSGFRGSLGFCPRHAHLMLDAGDGLGTAILYRAATQELLQTLSRVPDTPKSRTPFQGGARPPGTRQGVHVVPLRGKGGGDIPASATRRSRSRGVRWAAGRARGRVRQAPEQGLGAGGRLAAAPLSKSPARP